MGNPFSALGRWLARYLNKPVRGYEPFAISDPEKLARVLRPGDVLLIEGNTRISVVIKYLTQSTWSHAALYVGDALGNVNDPVNDPTLIEADIVEGVIAVPISKYADLNTRICRPDDLAKEDLQRVIEYAVIRLGYQYDLKNVIDLARYLLPAPPVPVRWRRRMIALGSGDPTRAICSTLVAQAFQSVRYPVLPYVEKRRIDTDSKLGYTVKEMLHIRHYSLFTPRDFDISPYFHVIKARIEGDFNYKALVWVDETDDRGGGTIA